MATRINYEALRALGERLRRWRITANRTQSDVAVELKIPQPMLSEYERGLKRPNAEIQKAIEALTSNEIRCEEWVAVRLLVEPANEPEPEPDHAESLTGS